MYYEDLDAPDQRAALMRFHRSTGGAYWNTQLVSYAERQQFSQLVIELEESGYGLSDQTLNVSMLSTDLVSDMANLPALSEKCALQQWLSFGQLLLKYQWGSNVSYCYWYGVVCCKTSVCHLSLCCIAAKVELSSNVWILWISWHMSCVTNASPTPMLPQGDQLNQYCSGPQSVASLTLSDTNLTGTIPQTFFSSMVDLQTLMLDDNPVRLQSHAVHVTM